MAIKVQVWRDNSRNPASGQPYRLAVLEMEPGAVPSVDDYIDVSDADGGDEPAAHGFGSLVTRVHWQYSGRVLAGINIYVM